MNNGNEGLIFLIVGLIAGGCIVGTLCSMSMVDIGKLTHKQTIKMNDCYAQYSAVRRFPR
jgi:hypothetical protein